VEKKGSLKNRNWLSKVAQRKLNDEKFKVPSFLWHPLTAEKIKVFLILKMGKKSEKAP
jgi:hypothetical protein